MKRKLYVAVLCIVMLLTMLTGCGELEVENFLEYSNSKEDYLKDIEEILGLSIYMEDSEEEVDEILVKVKKVKVYTREGKELKNTFVRILESTQEGLNIAECITESNYEKTVERLWELQTEIEDLMDSKVEEQLDALLLAAKEAGVTKEDLEKIENVNIIMGVDLMYQDENGPSQDE